MMNESFGVSNTVEQVITSASPIKTTDDCETESNAISSMMIFLLLTDMFIFIAAYPPSGSFSSPKSDDAPFYAYAMEVVAKKQV